MAEPMRHIEIVFLDPFSHTDTGWMPRAKAADEQPEECLLSGYLIGETQVQYVVAGMVHRGDDEVSMVSYVPKGCVVEIRDLP